MTIKTKMLIAAILVSLFVQSSAHAGFSLRKSTPVPSKNTSRKVDEVEREIIDAIISKKPEKTVEKNQKLYVKTKADKEIEAEEQKVVTGFGQDLPLVISLQQIVPSKYQFTLAKGIDPNLLTSWEGGKEWEKVLGDMLKSNDMSFTVKDTVVTVEKTSAAPEKTIKERAKSAVDTAIKKAKEVKAKVAKKIEAKKKPAPKTRLINKERKPKVKEKKVAEVEKIKLKYDSKKYDTDSAMTPVNIISSKNTPIKVDEDVAPFFDPNMLVDPNDPLARAKWVGHKYQTLREVLKEWSDKEGVELYWTIDYDYKLNKDVVLVGEFETAVAKLINVFRNVRPQPYGQLHQGDRGPLVLVVNSYDLSH